MNPMIGYDYMIYMDLEIKITKLNHSVIHYSCDINKTQNQIIFTLNFPRCQWVKYILLAAWNGAQIDWITGYLDIHHPSYGTAMLLSHPNRLIAFAMWNAPGECMVDLWGWARDQGTPFTNMV